MEEDLALLERWRQGDAAAGQELVRRHLGAIHRFFYNKAPAQAEDLAQATLLACVEGRERFDGRSSFRGYLFGIARNKLFRHYRNKKRRPDLDFGVTSLADVGGTPSSIIAANERKRFVQVALRELPLDHQIVLELFYWEGLSVSEVAAAAETTVGTVKSRLFRARKGLESALERAGRPALLATLRRDLDARDGGRVA